MEGLNWQTAHIPLAAGLNQKLDDRARQPPFLDKAFDVQFDEIGGVQTRKPFAALSANTLTDARRMVAYGDELLVFTKDSVYSYDAANDEYVSKATHLAVKVDEKPVFVTTGDQTMADRAELDGSIFYVWRDAGAGASYVAVVDKETGAVTVPPATLDDYTHCRLVALSTKVLLFVVDGSTDELGVFAINPADPTTSLDIQNNQVSETPTAIGTLDPAAYSYDVTRLIGADTAVGAGRLTPNTSHLVFSVTAGLTVTTSTKVRVCEGAIAIASHPSGTHVMVCRYNQVSAGTDERVQADYLSVSGPFTDVTVNQQVTTEAYAIDQITAAFRSVADSGQFRCYVFFTGTDTSALPNVDVTKSNHVDTAGTIGTASVFAKRQTIASRAFDHEGRAFVNLVFSEGSEFTGGEYAQLQNTVFLYRDDELLVAKMTASRAGGAISTKHLPGVQLVSGTTQYAWAGTERRIIPVSSDYDAYSDRGPRDIIITFDSNEARRCARIGKTLYITGGEVLQYDGVRLVEVGFHLYPHRFAGAETAGGSIATNGDYSYKMTWRYDNAQGERERSTTATIGTFTMASQPGGFTFGAIGPLVVTRKTSPAAVVEFWRTEVNPVLDAPSYLVTSTDPTDTSNPNRFLSNDISATALSTFNDELADTSITDLEQDFWAAELEDLAPPAASIIMATDTRLFLAGVAGDPHRVWYSKLRGADRVASFNDALTFDVPIEGGDITALAHFNGAIVVFRETAIYAFGGVGFSNVGDADGSQNFQLTQTIATDIGAVSHEAVALTDKGLIFKSDKGWMLLGGGGQVAYIGGPISDYDSDTVAAIHVLEGQHQVRVLTTSRMLVLDTVANQWAEWTISDGIHACLWRGTYCYLTSSNVKDEQTTYTDLTYGLDIETPWIKPADLQGAVRIRKLLVLGEYRSAHDLRIRIAYNYSSSYTDDRTWTVSPTTVGGPEQVKFGPSRPQCEAFKVRITAQAVGTTSAPTGEAVKLTGLAFEYGVRRGLFNRLPSAQRR